MINGASAEAARAMTDKVAATHPDLLKIRVDDNLGTGSKDAGGRVAAAIARAHELKLPLPSHIFYLADAKGVVERGPT